MNKTWKKILWVAVPTLAAAGAFFLWYKKSKPKPVVISNNNPAKLPPKKLSPSAGNPNFPLQSGSNNSSVKQLQTALGVTADGIFGPKTLAALQTQFGLNSIADQSTLNIIVAGAGTNGANIRAAATSLYNQFQAGGYDLQVQKSYFADEVTEDSDGHLTPTGMGFQMNVGDVLDNGTASLDGITILGLLILVISSGSLQGEYTVDPTCLTLTPHQDVSVIPVTNPTTGLTTFLGP